MASRDEAVKLRDVVRSKDPMGELCKNRLITPEACDWVKSALDPFHDLQLDNLKGYPDVSTEPTVVVKIRQAATISKPVGLPDGQNWDCHIVLSPVDFCPTTHSSVKASCVTPFGSRASSAPNIAGLIDNADGACARMDGLLVNTVPSDGTDGANMTFTPGHCIDVPSNGYQMQQINLDEYLDFDDTDLGVYRLVYSGFEVVNTTAQIYKQGAVTVYEYGNSFETGASCPKDYFVQNSIPTSVAQGPISQPTTYFRCPPNTLSQAKIMPGSHSWAAQDGCYNTAKFQSVNEFQSMTRRPFAIAQNNMEGEANSGYIGGTHGSFISDESLGIHVEAQSGANYGPGEPGKYSGPVHFSKMNTTGAYFTGLSPQTTLFVTWRVGIERLPAANKPAFLALSQPSATFDPNALVLYNLVANVLPPGCPQGYNDAGKWFRWISEAAQKSIPTVYPIVRTAAMLANSMGRPVIGGALNTLGTVMEPVAKNQAAKRLQVAVRNKQAQQKKPATQNWAQPTPRGNRSGGTNGLR